MHSTSSEFSVEQKHFIPFSLHTFFAAVQIHGLLIIINNGKFRQDKWIFGSPVQEMQVNFKVLFGNFIFFKILFSDVALQAISGTGRVI